MLFSFIFNGLYFLIIYYTFLYILETTPLPDTFFESVFSAVAGFHIFPIVSFEEQKFLILGKTH